MLPRAELWSPDALKEWAQPGQARVLSLTNTCPTVFFLHWPPEGFGPLGCLCFCPHIQAVPCTPGSKDTDKDPGIETSTAGAVQWAWVGAGVGLQGPLRMPLSRLQRAMAQPDQDKHSVALVPRCVCEELSLEGMASAEF